MWGGRTGPLSFDPVVVGNRETDLSDRWVRAGCGLDDPLLTEERRALVASYAALRSAVER
jgi:hypothetical protein